MRGRHARGRATDQSAVEVALPVRQQLGLRRRRHLGRQGLFGRIRGRRVRPQAVPGDAAAAIIVGGIVGAILDNNNRHGHHSDNYYPRPQPRRDDQWIDPTPQFDRDGNPNFDTHGNYQGCHGVGCMVDDPDE
ncbi:MULTISPECIES: hypothetical protein [unclassified Mesorhizobium]|uniref:hypothetical protein n=1 Tax=unclassified Mesorhizobium TaxID=325217 RepID=UPI0024176195|nr:MULTISPECIES: hypothetical protein [unclassified Mesorhizobium]WFP60534.1 hypothetical protein QAZ47_18650 [Mesorhizobium sp. WSM4904]WFP73755.1 hypothetical protein QAZ22_18550 [Mesorhizobium sp. WSM4906]